MPKAQTSRPAFQENTQENSFEVGKWYENMATAYLRNKNYHILEKNFRAAQYEIDLITLSPSGLLVFVEVKYRKTNPDFPIEAALSAKQQQCIILAAEKFLDLHEVLKKRNSQFDVLLITKTASKNAVKLSQTENYFINHIEQAFSTDLT